MDEKRDKVLVIPCSGIGKVHGLISREAAYLAVDEVAPDCTDVVCLALLVREDEGALAKVRSRPCITIDGCGKACAQKNVEIAGGHVANAVQVGKVLNKHRGTQPGTASELTGDGWAICGEIAETVAEEAERVLSGEEGA